MERWSLVIPVLAVIIGWTLNELSQLLRVRRTARAGLGRALVDLLELRLRLLADTNSMVEVIRRVPIEPGSLTKIREFAAAMLPEMSQSMGRYEDAVRAVAEADPLLAYTMRSQDIFPGVIERFRRIETENEEERLLVAGFEQILRDIGVSSLDRTARAVARRLGPLTWLRVVRLLRRQGQRPSEVDAVLGRLGLPPAAGVASTSS